MIDRATVEKILDATEIVDVISDFVTLRRRGANYIACCPFHNEKTPSFSVSPSKGIFKCFGCGKAGSAVTFVMEHEQMTYPEALKYLARKYGIEVHEQRFRVCLQVLCGRPVQHCRGAFRGIVLLPAEEGILR